MIKKGDLVECLRNYEDQFHKGGYYIAASDAKKENGYPHKRISVLADDMGLENGWAASFFKKVDDPYLRRLIELLYF